MVSRETRDDIVESWKAAGGPWAEMAGRSGDQSWGFGLVLEALGLLDTVERFRATTDSSVIVGVIGESLAVIKCSETPASHDATMRLVPLTQVDIGIKYSHARRQDERGQWKGSVALLLESETYNVALLHESDLRWARLVLDAQTGRVGLLPH